MALNLIPDYASQPRQQQKLSQTRSEVEQANQTQDKVRLRKAAQEFENMLTEMMMRSMRKATPPATLFGENGKQEWFTEMLDSEFVRRIGESGGLGYTESLLRSLDKYSSGPLKPGAKADGSQAAAQDGSKMRYAKSAGLSITKAIPPAPNAAAAGTTLPAPDLQKNIASPEPRNVQPESIK